MVGFCLYAHQWRSAAEQSTFYAFTVWLQPTTYQNCGNLNELLLFYAVCRLSALKYLICCRKILWKESFFGTTAGSCVLLCACTAERMNLLPVPVRLGGGCGTLAVSVEPLFFPKALQIRIMNMYPSSAQSIPCNSPGLSVEPGGACEVNPVIPNLQGLGVCVCVCLYVFVCEKKKGCAMCTGWQAQHFIACTHRRKSTKCSHRLSTCSIFLLFLNLFSFLFESSSRHVDGVISDGHSGAGECQ